MIRYLFDALSELQLALRGWCPPHRKCESREDLADWFMLAALAAGSIARSEA